MNKTQKSILSLVILGAVILLPAVALGQINYDVPTGGISDVPTLIGKILTPVWQVFIGLAVIMFLVAGILFMTAQGAPEKVATARSSALWAIVGMVIGVIAFSITTIISTVIS
jgi:hypothetical protein